MRKKRRKKYSKKKKNDKSTKKLKLFKKVKYFFIIVFLFIFITGIYFLLFKSSYFKLDNIEINGRYPLSAKKILTITSIKKNESLWSFDLKNVSNEIVLNYPEYKSVIVNRKLPHTLKFDFILRRPIAQIKSGRYFLVDKYAFILPQVKNVAIVDLPVIKGIDSKLSGIKPGRQCKSKALINAIKLLKVIRNLEDLHLDKLVYINASDYKNLVFKLNNGITVKIGNDRFQKRIKKLSYVLKEIQNEDIAYVDLRFKDPVISPR